MKWVGSLSKVTWIFGSQVATSLSGILTSVVVARWLGPSGLGELGLTRDIGAVAVPLLTCGISQAVTRAVGRARGGDVDGQELSQLLSTVFTMTLVFVLLAPCLILVVAPPLALFYDLPAIATTIQILALVVMVSVPYEIINAVMAGFEEFRALGIRQIISAVISPVIILCCVYYWGVAGAVFSSAIINLLLLSLLSRHLCVHIFRPAGLQLVTPALARAKHLLKVSAPLLGSILLMRPLNFIGSSAVVLHAGLTELGWFRVSYTFYGLAMVLPSALQMLLLPIFSRMSDRREIASQGIIISRVIIIFSFPIFVAGVLFSSPIARLLYGAKYEGAHVLIAMMLVVAFVAMVVSILETNVISQGRTARQLLVNVGNALVFVCAVQLLVPRFAHWGLVAVYLVTECVALCLYIYLFFRSHPDQVLLIMRPFAIAFLFLLVSIGGVIYSPWTALKVLLMGSAAWISYLLLNVREKEGIRRYVQVR